MLFGSIPFPLASVSQGPRAEYYEPKHKEHRAVSNQPDHIPHFSRPAGDQRVGNRIELMDRRQNLGELAAPVVKIFRDLPENPRSQPYRRQTQPVVSRSRRQEKAEPAH